MDEPRPIEIDPLERKLLPSALHRGLTAWRRR